MLYWLTVHFQQWLDESGLYPLVMVMYQLEFRALFAALLSFGMVLAVGPRVIRWLARQKIGDNPEFNHAEMNKLMALRAGTPTMGGLFVCGAILVSVLLVADVVHSRHVQLAAIILVWLAGVGAVDDWLKLTQARRIPGSRDGLLPWEKLLWQVGIGFIAGYFAYQAAPVLDAHVANFPFQRTYLPSPAIDSMIQPPVLAPHVLVLGIGLYTLVAILWITATSNAVNITDGIDGLAGSTLVVASLAMMALAYIAGSPRAAYFLLVPHVPGAGELMVVTGAMAGACLGFLWFNAHPARVFMGDTGSLPLGGLLAFVAVVCRQEILLLVVGGIFYLEMGSVILQTGWFKWTRHTEGKGRRLFGCAPLHHHFQMAGWSDPQIVTRAFVSAVVLSLIALASLKLR